MTVKRKPFNQFSEAEAYRLLQIEKLLPWDLTANPIEPTSIFQKNLERLDAIAIEYSEGGKEVLIDTILQEALSRRKKLRVWKEVTLKTQELIGRVEYLFAERIGYLKDPFVCMIEAKKDDFEQGRIQCLVGMKACQILNEHDGHAIDIFGMISNGFNWRLYKLTKPNAVWQSIFYSFEAQPTVLLGVLELIFAACEANL